MLKASSERSPQKQSRIAYQRVLISRKIFGPFYAKSREKFMEFEENNEVQGNGTRNLKEKHREFFTRETSWDFSLKTLLNVQIIYIN
jgi:hypothetical protein